MKIRPKGRLGLRACCWRSLWHDPRRTGARRAGATAGRPGRQPAAPPQNLRSRQPARSAAAGLQPGGAADDAAAAGCTRWRSGSRTASRGRSGDGDFGDLVEQLLRLRLGRADRSRAPLRAAAGHADRRPPHQRSHDRDLRPAERHEAEAKDGHPLSLDVIATLEGLNNMRGPEDVGALGLLIVSRKLGKFAALYAEPMFVANSNSIRRRHRHRQQHDDDRARARGCASGRRCISSARSRRA